MRRLLLIGSVLLAGVCVSVSSSSLAATGRGWLTGITQITFGCPGPARVGGPSCNPWHPFSHARFAVTMNAPNGKPIVSTRRVFVSDANGRFSLRLDAGSYTLTPLPQAHTHGGSPVRVQVRIGAVKRLVLRYIGFPMMV
jgi:hypothetical protein